MFSFSDRYRTQLPPGRVQLRLNCCGFITHQRSTLAEEGVTGDTTTPLLRKSGAAASYPSTLKAVEEPGRADAWQTDRNAFSDIPAQRCDQRKRLVHMMTSSVPR